MCTTPSISVDNAGLKKTYALHTTQTEIALPKHNISQTYYNAMAHFQNGNSVWYFAIMTAQPKLIEDYSIRGMQ